MGSTEPGSKRKGKSDKEINWLAWAAIVPALLTVWWAGQVINGNNDHASHALIAGVATMFLLWISDVGFIPETELRDRLAKATGKQHHYRGTLMRVLKDLEMGVDLGKIKAYIRKDLWPRGDE